MPGEAHTFFLCNESLPLSLRACKACSSVLNMVCRMAMVSSWLCKFVDYHSFEPIGSVCNCVQLQSVHCCDPELIPTFNRSHLGDKIGRCISAAAFVLICGSWTCISLLALSLSMKPLVLRYGSRANSWLFQLRAG